MTFYLGKAKQCKHCCPPGKRGNLGSALLLTPETLQPFLPLLFCHLTSLSGYLPPSLNILFIVTPCPFLFASLPLGTLLPLCALFSNPTGSPWREHVSLGEHGVLTLEQLACKKGKLAEKLLRSFPARQPSLSKPRRLLRCRPFSQSRWQERKRDQRCFCPQRNWRRNNCRSNRAASVRAFSQLSPIKLELGVLQLP